MDLTGFFAASKIVFHKGIRYTINNSVADFSCAPSGARLEDFLADTLKLPVGIDNFEETRKLGFYYIDKTKLIEQLLYKHYEQKVIILIDKYDVPLDDYRR